MTISVIGLGNVGLPLALAIDATGKHAVLGVDIDEKKINEFKALDHNFFRILFPGEGILYRQFCENAIEFRLEPVEADTFFICVPTPCKDGQADLRCVISALESIKPVLRDGNLVVIVSTVPPGTCETMIVPMLDATGKKVSLAYSPERIFPGRIGFDIQNLQLVIGCQRNSDFLRLSELYSEFNPMPKIHTALREAELVKILENCYRDVQIAFANEVASICHDMGMESREVIRAANTHPRVQILSPGLGVGGDCIPTDSQFLQGRACPLIQQARKTNSMQESRVAEQIFFLLNGIEKKKILILGAAYKGGVSDTTKSPSLKLAAILREFDAEVTIHDPLVPTYKEEPRGCFDLVVVGANHLVFADLTWLDKQAHQILDCVGIVRDGGKMEVRRL